VLNAASAARAGPTSERNRANLFKKVVDVGETKAVFLLRPFGGGVELLRHFRIRWPSASRYSREKGNDRSSGYCCSGIIAVAEAPSAAKAHTRRGYGC